MGAYCDSVFKRPIEHTYTYTYIYMHIQIDMHIMQGVLKITGSSESCAYCSGENVDEEMQEDLKLGDERFLQSRVCFIRALGEKDSYHYSGAGLSWAPYTGLYWGPPLLGNYHF